ncbi:hypothetical protein T10_7328 [Trichinella papuae]|uniref:Uncharacterized protein n=1 Tax=Trichinella papuae TaxID=268474 RepID=A0A0V1LYJ7_9BILA|nr:hypothetical protein T10_7328 [Trichinella papuae]
MDITCNTQSNRETIEFNGNRGILHLFFTVKNFYK